MRLPTGVTKAMTIAVAASVTACSPSAGSGATTSPAQTVTATPTPSPSTSTYSPENRAVGEVEDLLGGYYYPQLISCYADPPHTTVACLDNVAVGSELADLMNGLAAARFAGTRDSGAITVVSTNPVAVDLRGDPKAKPLPVPVSVTMRVCVDYSRRKSVFTKSGESALDPSFQTRHIETLRVVNMRYPDASGWRVSDVLNVPRVETC